MHDSIFKLTASREELESTFRMLHNAYVDEGIAYPNSLGLRATPYHLFPSTEVAVAIDSPRVVCTATLVRDGPLGLPMEGVYKGQVEERRARGISLAEISCLAHADRPAARYFSHVLGVMSLAAQAARSRGVEQLLLTVHPRHAKFYTRYLGCELIGEPILYESVRYNPAVALSLDMTRLAERHPHGYKKLFGLSHSRDELRHKPMSREVVRWVADLVQLNGRTALSAAALAAIDDNREYIIRGPWRSEDDEDSLAAA